jgi:hypothetical protein
VGEPVPFYLFIFSINRVVARIFAVNYYGYAVHSGLVGFDNEVYARFLFGVFKRGRYKNVLTVVGHRVYQMSDGFGDGQQVFKPDQFRGDEKNEPNMSADILYLLSIVYTYTYAQFFKLLST